MSIFLLLDHWQGRQRMPAKAIQSALLILLAWLVLAASLTLIPILRGPDNTDVHSSYLLVLGAGVQDETPSYILQARIDQAYAYLVAHPDTVCIASGGQGAGESLSEAQCIYDHLVARGIRPERIWLEDKATSTIENLRCTLDLIQTRTGSTPENITILSNEFHLFRASCIARDAGVEAAFVSAPTRHPGIRLSYTLREIFALWKYLIMGGYNHA